LYGIRRIGRTRIQLLSGRPYDRLTTVLDAEEHLAVKVAYVIYQKIIAAYADSNRRRGKRAMTRLIDSIRRGVPAGLEEIAQLGRTLWRPVPTSWPSSTTTPPTDPPKPSTAAWKPCAATPSDSETSPITESAHYCTAAHSTHSSTHSELRRAG
jgi:transposase